MASYSAAATACAGSVPASGIGVWVPLRAQGVGARRLPLALCLGSGGCCLAAVGVSRALARLQRHRRAQLGLARCGFVLGLGVLLLRQHRKVPHPANVWVAWRRRHYGASAAASCLGFRVSGAGALGLCPALWHSCSSPLQGTSASLYVGVRILHRSLEYRCHRSESVSLLSPLARIHRVMPLPPRRRNARRRAWLPSACVVIADPPCWSACLPFYPWGLRGPSVFSTRPLPLLQLEFHISRSPVHDRLYHRDTNMFQSALQPVSRS